MTIIAGCIIGFLAYDFRGGSFGVTIFRWALGVTAGLLCYYAGKGV